MVRLKRVFGTLIGPRSELPIRLGWMALVVILIYAIQHSPLSPAWQTAISEGVAIFGGVELILEKLNDIRRNRAAAQLRKEAEQAAAEAQSKNDELRKEVDKKQQENDELRLRVAELEEIVKNRPPQDDPEA